MRCFIAIDMPEDIKRSISDFISKIDHKIKGIRWVLPENIHLTLKFLGELEDNQIKEVKKKISDISSNHSNFDINISKIGGFPTLKKPNILWIGIEESENLKALYDDIENSLLEIGFEKEDRKFSPHLTIGRVKDKRDIDSVIKAIASFQNFYFGTAKVNEILLMRSILKPSGAEYSKIEIFNLKAKT